MAESEQLTRQQATLFLNYNVRWITRTFNTRAKVESILGPERAEGNISSHDYEAAIKFLPGFHRYYGLLFSSAALSAVYVLRRPSWSQMRLLGIATGSAFGSLAMGNGLTLKTHFDFVRSLDNPGGFAKAIAHIEKRSGTPLPTGPVIARKYNIEEGLHGNTDEPQVLFSPDPVVERPPQSQSPPPDAPDQPPVRPLSKWDQIRTNATPSTSSSWDALRQKHEKSQLQRSSTAPTNQNTERQPDDRAREQAQFDALLERERKLSSQNGRE